MLENIFLIFKTLGMYFQNNDIMSRDCILAEECGLHEGIKQMIMDYMKKRKRKSTNFKDKGKEIFFCNNK